MLYESRSRIARPLAVVAASALLLTATACSADESGEVEDVKSEYFDQSIYDLLPDDIKERGYVLNGVSAASPPVGYLDESGEYVGYESEMTKVLEGILGIEIREPSPINFDEIVPGLAAKRFDMSNLNDTAEREKTLDFVDLLYAGTGFVVAEGNPDDVSATTMCGLSIATEKGSAQLTSTLPAASEECVAAGEPEVSATVFPDNNAAVLALKSGRVQGVILDTQTAAWIAKTTDGLEFVETDIKNGLWGFGFSKGSELVPAFEAAAKKAFDEGLFDEIIKEYEIDGLRLEEVVVNGYTTLGF